MKKKLILIALTLVIAAMSVLNVFAELPSYSVKLRIEGKSENLFYGEISTNNLLNFTIPNVILLADSQNENLSVKGLDIGYITEINGDRIGVTEKGQDIYVIRVNGEYVPYSEIDSYTLKSGDEILVYYSDEFGDGIINPMVDTSKMLTERYIRFFYEKTSEDGKSFSNESVVGATVNWYCDEAVFTYTTDAKGGIYIDKAAFVGGKHKVEISLYREDGTPALLRFAPDYTIDVPVDVGDSPMLYAAFASAVLSLCAAVCLAISLKKKKTEV